MTDLTHDEEMTESYVQWALSWTAPTYVDARATLETRDLDRIRPLSRLASSTRLQRARSTLSSILEAGLDPYEPCYLRRWEEPFYRLSMPPVAELHEDKLILIDGLHRALALREAGIEEMRLVIVPGPLPPVAARPADWERIRVFPTDRLCRLADALPLFVSRRLKFRGYRGSYFRPVGRFLNGDFFCFPTLDAIRAHVNRAVLEPDRQIVGGGLTPSGAGPEALSQRLSA